MDYSTKTNSELVTLYTQAIVDKNLKLKSVIGEEVKKRAAAKGVQVNSNLTPAQKQSAKNRMIEEVQSGRVA